MAKAAARKKSARKSAPVGRPFRKGGDPRQGRGPAKGAPNAGRPPLEHVAWCRQMLSDPRCEAAVEAVLTDPSHTAFGQMWRELARRGYGMPAQTVAVSGQVAHTHRHEWKLGDRVIAWN